MNEKAILRKVKDEQGSVEVLAYLNNDGDLVIDGWEFGECVEEFFGSGIREHEWAWTIKASDIPLLMQALGETGDVLDALKARFSGDAAGGLKDFLKNNDIPHNAWSRLGD